MLLRQCAKLQWASAQEASGSWRWLLCRGRQGDVTEPSAEAGGSSIACAPNAPFAILRMESQHLSAFFLSRFAYIALLCLPARIPETAGQPNAEPLAHPSWSCGSIAVPVKPTHPSTDTRQEPSTATVKVSKGLTCRRRCVLNLQLRIHAGRGFQQCLMC